MNTGMQDAYNLAWKLALVETKVGKESPLLHSYTTERGAVGDMVLRNAATMTRVATLRNPFAQFMRNTVAGLAGMIPAFEHAMGRGLSELDIHYANSPLNMDSDGGHQHKHWKPGERLPDSALVDPRTGNPMNLLTAIRGTGFELLLVAASPSSVDSPLFAELTQRASATHPDLIRVWSITPSRSEIDEIASGRNVLLDPEQNLLKQSGATEDVMILVRPDRYLALVARVDLDLLMRYLDRILVPTPL